MPMPTRYPSQIRISTCSPPSLRSLPPNGIPQQTVGTTADTYLIFKICGPGCEFADDNIVGWTASDTFNSAKSAVAGQFQIGTLPSTRFKTDPMINAATPEPIVVREQN